MCGEEQIIFIIRNKREQFKEVSFKKQRKKKMLCKYGTVQYVLQGPVAWTGLPSTQNKIYLSLG